MANIVIGIPLVKDQNDENLVSIVEQCKINVQRRKQEQEDAHTTEWSKFVDDVYAKAVDAVKNMQVDKSPKVTIEFQYHRKLPGMVGVFFYREEYTRFSGEGLRTALNNRFENDYKITIKHMKGEKSKPTTLSCCMPFHKQTVYKYKMHMDFDTMVTYRRVSPVYPMMHFHAPFKAPP